jgi:hypothetical protein
MDLANLVNPPRWVFRSEAAEEWNVHSYSKDAIKLVESYSTNETSGPIEAVRSLMGVMCKTHLDDQKDDNTTSTKPTANDLAAFTEDDINGFSRKFLENDSSLNAEKELKKAEGQSDAEFFLKVLAAKNQQQNYMVRDMLSKQKTVLPGLLNSQNSGISKVAKDIVDQTKALESYFSPLNSISETSPEHFKQLDQSPNQLQEANDRLGKMTDRLEILVEFGNKAILIMNGLQAASLKSLEESSTQAKINSKTAQRATKVSIVAVLFAVFFAVVQICYTEFWRVPQDTAAMQAAVVSVRSEISDLQAATVAAVADSVNSTGETNMALLQKIEMLLQQQRVREQAMIEALEAISEKAQNPAQ